MERAEIERRFRHHPPRNEADIRRHEMVRADVLDLAHTLNDALPEGREKSQALTKLEEVGFHAHAALARARAVNADIPGPPEPQG